MAEVPTACSRSAFSSRISERPRPLAEQGPPRSRCGSCGSIAAVGHGKVALAPGAVRLGEASDEDQRPGTSAQRSVSACPRLQSSPTASTMWVVKLQGEKKVEDLRSPSLQASPRNSTLGSPVASLRRSASKRLRPDLSLFAGCTDPAKFDAEDETDKVTRGANRTDKYLHRPSSVARFIENADVAEFIAWVEGVPQGWNNIHSMFIAWDQYGHGGHQPTAGLAKKKWVRLLMNWRYPNEAGLHTVWDEIAKETNAEKPEKGAHAATRMGNAPVEAEITLPQFKRFERRVCSVNAVLSPTDKNSPARRFVQSLRKKYGSSLRAWRRVLDVHSTGRVTYADFLNGCRSMGLGSQGRSVWSNLKEDQGHPMEFHELDPEEGDNLQEFAKVLWERTELNMDTAWLQMDVMRQHYLTPEQFKVGCEAFGWRGNAKLLFKGLDSSGVGRLKEDDFRYIGKGSHIGAQRVMASQKPIAAFVSWCNQDIGGVERLLELVGFYGKRELDVEELAKKLESLGFYGSAKEVASKAAKHPQSSVVTAASLSKLIKCSHYKPDELGPMSPTFRSSPSRSMVEHRFEWDAAVNDFALHNGRLCQYSRGLFSREGHHPITTKCRVDQACAPSASSPRPRDWESPIQNHSPNLRGVRGRSMSDLSFRDLQQNSTQDPSGNSKYTGDPSDTSHRNLQRKATGDIVPNSSCTGDFLDTSPRNLQRSGTRDPTDKVPAHISKYAGDCSDKPPGHLQRNGTRDTMPNNRRTKYLSSRSDLSSRSTPDLQRDGTGDPMDKIPSHITKYTGDRSDKSFRNERQSSRISGTAGH